MSCQFSCHLYNYDDKIVTIYEPTIYNNYARVKYSLIVVFSSQLENIYIIY